ncbi:MAG TPA: AEC family transporter [Spirochaetia bacterium]|nr:AEC family transporter [Spirochaetia bacterium]
MTLFVLILGRIAPIFLVMGLGFAAFSLRWIDAPFIRTANVLTYRIALPSLIFLSVLGADFTHGLPLKETLAFTISIIGATIIGYIVSAALRLPRERRAAFVQGSIRGNFAILAIAVFQQVLGPDSLKQAAVYLAFFIVVHNLIGIAVLSDKGGPEAERKPIIVKILGTLWTSLTNPLIIAIYLGVLVSLIRVQLPAMVLDTLGYLKQLALPLALLGVGGSMRIYYSEGHLPLAFGATAIKLLIMPAIAVTMGILFKLPQIALLMVAVFAGSPAAVATYSLADGMGADRNTAGSIILVSHVLCLVTITILIALIRGLAA